MTIPTLNMLKILMLGALILPSLCFASIPQKDSEPKDSIAPFAGYTPTYQFFLGGGYFYRSPRFEFDIETVLTFVDAYQLLIETNRKFDAFNLKAEFKAKRGFDPFYGYGTQTKISDRTDIVGDIYENDISVSVPISEHVSLESGLELRIRSERGTNSNPDRRVFPDETTGAIKIEQSLDYRDRKTSPTDGWLQEFKLLYVPAIFASLPSQESFVQLELAFSFYRSITDKVIFATHLRGGTSFGNPTYLYQYTLGGADRLRGFHVNRFRGRHFFVEQTELRFPIWKIVHGGIFVDIGAAGNNALDVARISYGGGFRIGLPPDYIEKARIDIGFASDQFGVFIDFSHAF